MPAFLSTAAQLLRLSLPISIGLAALVGMVTVDTIVSGNAGITELAGLAVGATFLQPLMLFCIGLCSALTPLVGQLTGADRRLDIGRMTQQGLLVALITGLAALVLLLVLLPLIKWLPLDAAVADAASDYLFYMAFALPAICLGVSLKSFCDGQGVVLPAMVVNIGGFLLNIPLDYLFVYGKFGLPAMGTAGCGLTSLVIMWLNAFILFVYTRRRRFAATGIYRQPWHLRGHWLGHFIKVGLPMAFTYMFDELWFTASMALIIPLGTEVVGAHKILENLYIMSILLGIGLAHSGTIITSHRVGAGDFVAARKTAFTAIACSTGITLLVAAALLAGGEHLLALYTDSADIVAMTLPLLPLAVAIMLIDTTQMASIAACRAYSDTFVPFLLQAGSYWLVGFACSVTLVYGCGVYGCGLNGFNLMHLIFGGWVGEGFGLRGVWWGFVVAMGLSATLMLWRINRTSRAAIAQQ